MEEKDKKLIITKVEEIDNKFQKIKIAGLFLILIPFILTFIFISTALILLICKEEKIAGDYYTNIETSTISIFIIISAIFMVALAIGLICFLKYIIPFTKEVKKALLEEKINQEEKIQNQKN